MPTHAVETPGVLELENAPLGYDFLDRRVVYVVVSMSDLVLDWVLDRGGINECVVKIKGKDRIARRHDGLLKEVIDREIVTGLGGL